MPKNCDCRLIPEKKHNMKTPDKPSSTHSDEEVVSRFGMTLDKVELEAKQVADGSLDDGLSGAFSYTSPLDLSNGSEPMRK